MGFQPAYKDEGFLIIERDGIEIHFNLFEPSENPKRSVCYIGMRGIDELYEQCLAKDIVSGHLAQKEYGMKEFVVCDPDRHLIIFSESTDSPTSTT